MIQVQVLILTQTMPADTRILTNREQEESIAVQTTACHGTVYGWVLPPQAYADVQIGNRVLHGLEAHLATALIGIIASVDEENMRRLEVAANAGSWSGHDGNQRQQNSGSDSGSSEDCGVTMEALYEQRKPSTLAIMADPRVRSRTDKEG